MRGYLTLLDFFDKECGCEEAVLIFTHEWRNQNERAEKKQCCGERAECAAV